MLNPFIPYSVQRINVDGGGGGGGGGGGSENTRTDVHIYTMF